MRPVGSKNEVRHKLAYKFFSIGKACKRCGLKGKMGRENKHTGTIDTRYNICFDCVPNWELECKNVEYNESNNAGRCYAINGRYPYEF